MYGLKATLRICSTYSEPFPISLLFLIVICMAWSQFWCWSYSEQLFTSFSGPRLFASNYFVGALHLTLLCHWSWYHFNIQTNLPLFNYIYWVRSFGFGDVHFIVKLCHVQLKPYKEEQLDMSSTTRKNDLVSVTCSRDSNGDRPLANRRKDDDVQNW